VIDHESSTCDQVSLCLCLSNKVGRSISGDVMMLLNINEELYFFSIILLSEILLFKMRFVFLRCGSYSAWWWDFTKFHWLASETLFNIEFIYLFFFFVLLLLCVNLVKMQKNWWSPVYIPSNVLVQLPIVFQQELDYYQQAIKVMFVIQPSSSRLWWSWSSFAIRSLLIIWEMFLAHTLYTKFYVAFTKLYWLVSGTLFNIEFI
jgi:hypothetical protein